MKLQLAAGPSDFNRLGSVDDLLQMPWGKIPTYYYDLTSVALPMTAEEFSDFFGNERQVFVLRQQAEGNRQTNTATGTSVTEAFVACGIGVMMVGEGEAFTVRGASLDAPTGVPSGTNTPNIMAFDAGCYCGSANIETATLATGTQRHATFWWGAPTWRFIEAFFRSYRLQLSVGRRFLLVDEGLQELGLVPSTPEFEGASSSEIPTMPFINAVNTVMEEKGIGQAFVAPTTRLLDGETAVVPPLSVPVTYGHPKIHGLANRVYCLARPLMFIPGMQFSMSFQRDVNASAFRPVENVVTANCITQHPNFESEVNIGETPIANAGLSCTIPGGTISMGLVMKGYALQPTQALDYIMKYVVPDSAQSAMYCGALGSSEAAAFWQNLKQLDSGGQLAGLLKK